MQMIDVLKKLQEITEKSPEIARALDNVNRMNAPVKEGIEIKTTGQDAVLAQIIKLAGLVGGVNTPEMAAAPGDVPGGAMGMGGSPITPLTPPPAGPVSALGGPGPAQPNDLTMGSDIGMDVSMPDDDMEMGLPGDMPGDIPGPDTMVPDARTTEEGGDRPYTNSPKEFTKGMSAAVPSGNDLARPKATAPKVGGGDNPMQPIRVRFD